MIVLFNKPYGVVTQFSAHPGHKTLADFGLPKRVYAAGRLDHDSEGLVVLTDDGALQHQLTEPRHYHKRTYLTQVERVPDDAALEKLRRGPRLSDGPTRPCRVQLLSREPDLPPRDPPIRFRKNVPTAWLELTLTEGRNRQVRRMTAAIGHPTLRLVRARVGPFLLEGIASGEHRVVPRPPKLF
ncbi:MAG: pseudouridine synthase [Elusimicrobia bacterium]|nr:pseudouridine synthase [Elusimicrobiota bacterium]